MYLSPSSYPEYGHSVERVTRELGCTEEQMAVWESELLKAKLIEAGVDIDGTPVLYIGHPEVPLESIKAMHKEDCITYNEIMRQIK